MSELKIKIKATLKWMPRNTYDGNCCDHCALYGDDPIYCDYEASCGDGYFIITKAKVRKPKEIRG